MNKITSIKDTDYINWIERFEEELSEGYGFLPKQFSLHEKILSFISECISPTGCGRNGEYGKLPTSCGRNFCHSLGKHKNNNR